MNGEFHKPEESAAVRAGHSCLDYSRFSGAKRNLSVLFTYAQTVVL